ncbi:RDD family protein [Streptomyces sp. SP18CS02]|uniref:RDD family protein n=1 Tax=Streptomyces sp. SP18CS02 TaxID=3002531 RepID=UPI002E790C4A|nr:RDD family protein [Streptomyces sp. SP18CS02]MEE1752286.1 RDD family protein [Streptomyces sp. SP18CS02]
MSAPTPATGDGSPTPGYYPDPSIPGYIRFWNGGAWVPGTSRPAPGDGEAMPAPPASAAPAPAPAPVPSVEETGPVFFDEEPLAGEAVVETHPEPASAWQADASRQAGFGGERDRRVSWGAEGQDPRTPADPRRAPADPTGGALPGVRNVEPEPGAAGVQPQRRAPGQGVPEGTVTIRAQQSRQEQPADGTMTIRALKPEGPKAPESPQIPARTPPAQPQRAQQAGPPHVPQAQPNQAQAHLSQPPRQAQPQPAPGVPATPAAPVTPVTPGPGGGAASWAQQVHQLAQPQLSQPQAQPQPQSGGRFPEAEAQQPVVPWKPPVADPFLAAAQAQANARPAGLGKRLAARLIDTVVLGALVGAASFPFVSSALGHIDGKIEQAKQSGETVTVWLLDGTTSMHFGIALALLLVLGALYEALPTARWGRTLGKKVCGLEVRDIESHGPPAFGAALRRWLVYGVLGVLVIGIANVLWCLVDRPWRQCWHDKAAHTFVAG